MEFKNIFTKKEEQEELSCFPNLSFTERLIGFGICCALGIYTYIQVSFLKYFRLELSSALPLETQQSLHWFTRWEISLLSQRKTCLTQNRLFDRFQKANKKYGSYGQKSSYYYFCGSTCRYPDLSFGFLKQNSCPDLLADSDSSLHMVLRQLHSICSELH